MVLGHHGRVGEDVFVFHSNQKGTAHALPSGTKVGPIFARCDPPSPRRSENGTSPRISTPVAHLPGVLERLMKIFWRRCCSLSCCLHGRRDTATGQNDRAGSCRPLPALCQPTGERAPSKSAASSGSPSVSAPSISAPSISATSVAPRWSQKWLGVREHFREHLGFVPTVVWQTMCGIRQARGGMSRVSPACIAVGFLSFVTF